MVPTQQELLDFLKKRDLVNFSIIAKFFEINNSTVSDLIADLEKKKLVEAGIKKEDDATKTRLQKRLVFDCKEGYNQTAISNLFFYDIILALCLVLNIKDLAKNACLCIWAYLEGKPDFLRL